MDKNYIKNIVAQLQEERSGKNLVPCYAPIVDIKNIVCEELMQELRAMCKSGELEYHRTINGFSISIPPGR